MKFKFIVGEHTAYATVTLSRKVPGTAELKMLIVPKAIRNRGIARALLSQICIWADSEFVKVFLTVVPFDRPKIENYNKLQVLYNEYDFHPTGEDDQLVRKPNP